MRAPFLIGLVFLGQLTGCAGTKVRLERSDLAPLPLDQSHEFREAYYKAHSIQGVQGNKVLVNGRLLDESDEGNGLGYVDGRNRPLVFKTARPGYWQLTSVALVPVGAAGGFIISGVLSLVGAGLQWFFGGGRPQSYQDPGNFLFWGTVAGASVGTIASGILIGVTPRMAERSSREAAIKYNRRLWIGLELGSMPLDQGVAANLHLRY